MATTKRTRRSAEQMIADLQDKIAKIKSRADQAKVKKDPALRHMHGAVRSIDKALAATKDVATRTALNEARTTLAATLALQGVAPRGRSLTPRARRSAVDPQQVLDFLKKHPGARSEEMAAELSTDAPSLRAVLHRLRDDGKVRVEGQARATRYSVTGRS
jgi:hypothetical protein